MRVFYVFRKTITIFFDIVYVLFVAYVFLNILFFTIKYYQKHQLYGDLFISENLYEYGTIFLFKTKLGTVSSSDRWTIKYPYLIGKISMDDDDINRIYRSRLDITIHGNNFYQKKYYYIYNCTKNRVDIYTDQNDFVRDFSKNEIQITSFHDETASIFYEGDFGRDPRDFRPTCQYVPESDIGYHPIDVIY